jgi:hypothetical protein
MQKWATNQAEALLITTATKTGINAPANSPDHNVTRGMGSGSKMLYGILHGTTLADLMEPPQQSPPTMCPISCVKVMTPHETINIIANQT